MYHEDDLIPLSALQHLLFCERQCALIHVERLWFENRYTAEGRIMHDHVHTAAPESRGNVRIEFGVPLRSLTLGLVGQADVVEYHKYYDSRGCSCKWRPFPVEYKRGRTKKENWDQVQLCAQAICLEEMLEMDVPQGYLFYGKMRRRQNVIFDADLRAQTADATKRLHNLIDCRRTPAPVYGGKCDHCSFLEMCLPKALDEGRSAVDYLQNIIEDI
jgi:CRISPR-associated exonuclease Cas4